VARKSKVGVLVGAGAAVVAAALIAALIFQPAPERYFFSFEGDMEGWVANRTDLEFGEGLVNWSIERSQERASDWSASLKFDLDNLNDAGKVWVEKAFDVEAGRTYGVTVEYSFASSDFGSINLWRIITGVLLERPETSDDLEPTYQDRTGNGMSEDSGYVWLDKRYDFNVQAASSGKLWVVIGVWGTWETARTYYIDGISVELEKA
jgi:hypothetical protein